MAACALGSHRREPSVRVTDRPPELAWISVGSSGGSQPSDGESRGPAASESGSNSGRVLDTASGYPHRSSAVPRGETASDEGINAAQRAQIAGGLRNSLGTSAFGAEVVNAMPWSFVDAQSAARREWVSFFAHAAARQLGGGVGKHRRQLNGSASTQEPNQRVQSAEFLRRRNARHCAAFFQKSCVGAGHRDRDHVVAQGASCDRSRGYPWCARCGRKRYRCRISSTIQGAVDLRPPWDPDGRARLGVGAAEQPAPLFHSRFRSPRELSPTARPHAPQDDSIWSTKSLGPLPRSTGQVDQPPSVARQITRRSATERRGWQGSGDTSESQQNAAQWRPRIDTNQPHLTSG